MCLETLNLKSALNLDLPRDFTVFTLDLTSDFSILTLGFNLGQALGLDYLDLELELGLGLDMGCDLELVSTDLRFDFRLIFLDLKVKPLHLPLENNVLFPLFIKYTHFDT